MGPYDIMKSFFSDKEWGEIDKIEKSKNFFIINRTMSIAFPLQANAFNHTKIDPVSVVNYWRETLVRMYNSPPGWFFTSSNKKEKAKKYVPSDEVSLFIREKYEISEREVKELLEYYPSDFKKFCDSIKDLIS